jgi:hypothetical protein
MHDEKCYMDPKRVKSAKSEAACEELDASSLTIRVCVDGEPTQTTLLEDCRERAAVEEQERGWLGDRREPLPSPERGARRAVRARIVDR